MSLAIVTAVAIAILFIRWLDHRDRPNPFANPEVRYEGGDGSAPNQAIIVRGADSDIAGTAATFAWMHDNIGPKDIAWRLNTHSTGRLGHVHIDTFDITLADGAQRTLFFDVTEGFGKPYRPRNG